MKEALIIFVRNPVPGKVKTRLAATIGSERALDIYISMLHYTHSITSGLPCSKYVFYAEEIGEKDLWDEGPFRKELQLGHNLGQRMQHAFEQLFAKGYQSVVIIGSDNMELKQEIISRSFGALQQYDAVIGPSTDGGYYLLGLRRPQNPLFENMCWSTDTVLQETIQRCRNNNLHFTQLPLLNDIDDEAGWNRYQSAIKGL